MFFTDIRNYLDLTKATCNKSDPRECKQHSKFHEKPSSEPQNWILLVTFQLRLSHTTPTPEVAIISCVITPFPHFNAAVNQSRLEDSKEIQSVYDCVHGVVQEHASISLVVSHSASSASTLYFACHPSSSSILSISLTTVRLSATSVKHRPAMYRGCSIWILAASSGRDSAMAQISTAWWFSISLIRLNSDRVSGRLFWRGADGESPNAR